MFYVDCDQGTENAITTISLPTLDSFCLSLSDEESSFSPLADSSTGHESYSNEDKENQWQSQMEALHQSVKEKDQSLKEKDQVITSLKSVQNTVVDDCLIKVNEEMEKRVFESVKQGPLWGVMKFITDEKDKV